MSLKITHTTKYTYDHPVNYALQKVRLTPLTNPLQEVVNWNLTIVGGKAEASYVDHYGNHVELVSTTPGATELIITAEGEVETKDMHGVLGQVYGRAPLWHFRQQTALTEPSPEICEMTGLIGESDDALTGLHALSTAILEAVPYDTGPTESGTTAQEAFEIGKGVCQDHSHIFISAARHAGIPARYVSGYLRMTDRVDQDASHAWAEAHVDGLGWVGFDVSNGISPDTNYVRTAIGRDASDAAPVSGLRMGQGDETMVVSLQVQQ